MRALLASSLLILVVSIGCAGRGHSDDDPGGDGNQQGGGGGTLTLTPADPVLNIDGKNPATVAFRVLRGDEDVTASTTLTLDDSRLGSFAGGTFRSNPGSAGKTTVRARLDNDTGSTTLTLRVSAVIIAPGAPADAPDKFGGAKDPSRAPELVYPPDGALIPPNLNELEIHWQKKTASLFEVSFVGDAIDLRVYTTCNPLGAGCGLTPDELSWKLLSQSGRGRSVQLTVRGAAPDGGGVGTSATQTLSFGDDDIQGGLYYWGASAGGIFRYDFGRRGQKAEAYYTPGLQAGLVTCVGCHALSRNGKRIAVGLNIPGPAQMRALDVATRTKLFEVGNGIPLAGGSDYQAFTADGERLVTVEKGGLTLRNANTGVLIGQAPGIENSNMPDIAPDGTQVVFARSAMGCVFGLCVTLSVTSASLMTVPLTGDAFGMPQELVPSGGQNNYYPSFSPDGRFVVFNRAAGDSYDAADARVMIVPTQGGNAIDLASVNALAGNSWPKWSPFVQRFRGSTILWVTFSSKRPYGLRDHSTAQLWMVPLDVAKLQKGEDPGFPPFWLPFQDLATGNHIAQWVEKVERAPCSMVDMSGCMPTEMCVDGKCVPGIQ